MFRALKLGKEARDLRRRFPEPWRLGEMLAADRLDILPGEDRPWSPTDVDRFLSEAAEDAIKIAEGLARREGRTLPSEVLKAVGIACGLAVEEPLRAYVQSGGAEADRRARQDFRADYDAGRQLAENQFYGDPEKWIKTAPAMSSGVEILVDMSFGPALTYNAMEPPVQESGVFLGGFTSRMAELVRHYIVGRDDELRAMSEKTRVNSEERTKVLREVEAEFRAKGNYSGAEMIAETDRRMAQRAKER
jgi:hypothetical protein